MTSRAIPTEYKGINFRSRLEATWAVFLDSAGITWAYEPIDLAGYIPDFVLTGRSDGDELLEVKPVLRPADLWEHVGKIEESGWKGPALIVGAVLPLAKGCPAGLRGGAHQWGYAPAFTERDGELWAKAASETQWFPGAAVKVKKATPGKQSKADKALVWTFFLNLPNPECATYDVRDEYKLIRRAFSHVYRITTQGGAVTLWVSDLSPGWEVGLPEIEARKDSAEVTYSLRYALKQTVSSVAVRVASITPHLRS